MPAPAPLAELGIEAQVAIHDARTRCAPVVEQAKDSHVPDLVAAALMLADILAVAEHAAQRLTGRAERATTSPGQIDLWRAA